ncbi:hypothetical protein [Mesorhizobium loti]|nr:hypothetical protein [Mesorhizobium loti]
MNSLIVPLVSVSILIMAFALFAYYGVYRYVKRNLLLHMNLNDNQIRMSLDSYVFGKSIPNRIKLLYIAFEFCIPAVAVLFGVCAFEAHRVDMVVLLGLVTVLGLMAAFGGLYKMIKTNQEPAPFA